jgi:hypothetical protein
MPVTKPNGKSIIKSPEEAQQAMTKQRVFDGHGEFIEIKCGDRKMPQFHL